MDYSPPNDRGTGIVSDAARNRPQTRRGTLSLSIAGFILLPTLFSGCGTTVKVHKEDPARQKQWAKAASTHAMLSLLSTQKEGNDDLKAGPVSKSVEELPLTEEGLVAECRSRLARQNWRRIESYAGKKGDASEGLYFEVWERKTPKHEVVFAFRGTNFDEPADWRSNLRWFRFFRKLPNQKQDQYDVVNREVLRIHKQLSGGAGGESIVFSATGHSLGGGLAQHAFYACLPAMDRVVVFNTTPVTGYRDLSPAQRLKFRQTTYRDTFPGYRILRVHENGEILEYVRRITQTFYKQDSLIRAVEFQVERDGNVVNKHYMSRLTRGILKQDLEADENAEKLKADIRDAQPQSAMDKPEPAISPEP